MAESTEILNSTLKRLTLVLWDFPWCGGSCHSERSEESRSVGNETLRCAQGDNAVGNFNTYHANSQRAK